ncbi:MAG: 4Fe-4S binding protein [Sphaerochaetaceae bacterium]|nr:4Fe-4S binding protein [Sphaerochaetaceae bacterium]
MVEHVHLLYFSPTGNSRTTANAVAFGLESNIDLNHDLTKAVSRREVRSKGIYFDKDDVVVICAPVYAGRLPSCFAELFPSSIHADGSKAVLAVTYGNRAYEDALVELEDLCRASGFIPLCAGAFVGVHSYDDRIGSGRPDAKDLDAMHTLGRIALEKLNEGEVLMGAIEGKRPYKSGIRSSDPPFGAMVSGHCSECGACVEVCPVDAIDPATPGKTDVSRCIRCSACIKACPLHVRGFFDSRHAEVLKMLEERCLGTRREAQLFF